VSELWTQAAGDEIGVDWLRTSIAPGGDFGRRARAAERPFRRGDEAAAAAAIERVAAVARDVSGAGLARLQETIAAAPDPGAFVARARAGVVLGDAEFFDAGTFADAVATVRAEAVHVAFADVGLPPPLDALRAALAPGRTPQRTFYLGDAYDPDLAAARADELELRARYDAERSRLGARVAAYAGLDHVREGEFILMRDRIAGPLPAEVRVLREAATYLLCELALDDGALGALSALEGAQRRVGACEDAVRTALTAVVGAAAALFDEAALALGALDAFLARARFARSYEHCVPEIGEDVELAVEGARFLPLAASLALRGHRYAPLTFALDGVGVLTGPNMGGKSAALRTCGFVAACVALGVPVPAAAARVALFDEIAWIGIGPARDQASLLSSFGSEVVALRDFLERAPPRALVLVDEFARTTSPREGRALVVALLAQLRGREAIGLVATHLSGVAGAAGVAHFAVAGLRELPAARGAEALDLDAAIERIAAVMDYSVQRVERDGEPRADAIALAEVLGLDARLIARARDSL
jgi:DNA mismatch repair protein MutS2